MQLHKHTWLIWLVVAVITLSVPGAIFAQTKFFFTVVDDSDEGVDGVSCSVYDSSDATIILHTSSAMNASYRGALISTNGGLVHWYSSSREPVNVRCFGGNGSFGEKVNLSKTTHKLRLTSGLTRVSRFPYTENTAETRTGIFLPTGATITSVIVHRVTAMRSTGIHLNVGFAGSHDVSRVDALVALADLQYPGMLQIHATLTAQASLAPTAARASHIGFAVRHITAAGPTNFFFRPYLIHTGALEITYQVANAGGSAAGVGGHVYIYWYPAGAGVR